MRTIILALLFLLAPCITHAEESTHQIQTKLLLQASPVAGYRYHEGKEVWNDLRVGDPLDLVREPDNPYDPLAVRVDWHGHVLGYVPRSDNRALARLLDRGEAAEARIVKLRKSRNPRERVLFEVYVALAAQPQKVEK